MTKKKMKTILLIALLIGLVVSQTTIPFRVFSSSPALGRAEGTSTDPRNSGYGAIKIFIEKVDQLTNGSVKFVRNQWAVPAGKRGIDVVNGTVACVNVSGQQCGLALYDAGAELNVDWGFIWS